MKRALILLLALLLGGCATSGDMQQLQNQISELQDQLAAVKRTASSKEEVQNINQRSSEQTEQLLKSNATLVAKVEQIDERVQNAQGSIEQTNYRLDRMAQQVTAMQRDVDNLKAQAAATAAAVNPTGTPSMSEVNVPAPGSNTAGAPSGGSSGNPIDIYNGAYRDYQRGNFDLAIGGFRDFIEQSPNSDLTDNAAYWIGESLFSQKKYQEAIAQFDSVVTKYPKSDKVPGALLKKGYAYIALGQKSQGIVQLQYVLHEHPSSAEAGLARQKLKQLGVETR